MSRFTDKVALVTDAGTGLGKAAALAFAAEGANVVLAGRTADRGNRIRPTRGPRTGHGRPPSSPT